MNKKSANKIYKSLIDVREELYKLPVSDQYAVVAFMAAGNIILLTNQNDQK